MSHDDDWTSLGAADATPAGTGARNAGGGRGSKLPIDDADLGRIILDSALDYAIVTLSPEGLVTSWSDGAERILGWREDEIVGQSVELFFTDADNAVERARTEMREAAATGRARDERYHMCRDGSRFYAEGMMVPLRPGRDGRFAPEDGPVENPVGFLKIFRDRTHVHETEVRARELETGVAMALRASGSIGLYQFDPEARLVWGDESCSRMFDLDASELDGGMPADRFFERIHLDDVDRVADAQKHAAEAEAHLDITFRVVHRDGATRWVHTLSDFNPPAEDAGGDGSGDGTVRVRSGMMIDVTRQHYEARMSTALLETGDRLRGLDDPRAMGALAAEVLGRTLGVNRAGHGELDADGDTITILDDWTARGAESLAGVLRYSDFGTFAEPLRRGEAVVIEDARSDDRVPDAAALEGIGIRSLVNVPLLEHGRLKAVLFVNDDRPRAWTETELAFVRGVFDRTYAAIDRTRAVNERELMNKELAHRMKNVLTIAQVVATQSLRHARTLEEGHRMVGARLAALGRAQDMLTQESRDAVDIRSVIEDAMRPHMGVDDARLMLDGPRVVLSPQQVLGLSLGVHELATNAGKYGALAGDAGRVEVRWRVDAGDAFGLTWTESGACAAVADGGAGRDAVAKGFGSNILERVVGGYFNGRSKLDIRPDGAVFTIEGRLDDVEAR
ncbi:HWE histidine kinase domain-containing protein [Jannaschia sp. LMIT008]|uniref:PAS domain-containing sensor histidine kinase n=1 Tax=Jannaschia maritima TaxID=3032585 RepID=UPI002811BA4F|nr:HWE histidine kinase domain-containing protein [Jannaschia sp. LMIT008]